MKKIVVNMLAVAMIAAMATTGSAADKPKYEWRMQVIHSTSHTDFIQNQKTAEKIFKATGGRLKITVAPYGT